MTTRIRLRRMGAKKRPFYRVVVADQRAPRDGRFIEVIGKYHPLNDPSLIEIDEERAIHWLRVGAQPSGQVRNLMTKVGIWEKFVAERPSAALPAKPERPVKEKISKKAQAKASEPAKPAVTPAAPVVEAPAASVPEPVEPEETTEAPAAEETTEAPAAEETTEAPAAEQTVDALAAEASEAPAEETTEA